MKKLILLSILSVTIFACNKSNEVPTPKGNKIVYDFKCTDNGIFNVTAIIKRDDVVLWEKTEEKKNAIAITKYFELQEGDQLEFSTRTADRFNHPTELKIYVDDKVIRSRDKNCTSTECNTIFRP